MTKVPNNNVWHLKHGTQSISSSPLQTDVFKAVPVKITMVIGDSKIGKQNSCNNEGRSNCSLNELVQWKCGVTPHLCMMKTFTQKNKTSKLKYVSAQKKNCFQH